MTKVACLLGLAFLGQTLFSWQPGVTQELQTSLPITGQVLSTALLNGYLELGSLSFIGHISGNSTVIDAVYPIDQHDQIINQRAKGLPYGSLYVMGVHPAQAGLMVSVAQADTTAVDLLVSYTGDLQLYLSAADTSWEPGIVLSAATHFLLPADNHLVPLQGSGGLIGDEPLSADSPELGLDMAVKIIRSNQAGSKSGQLTFTVIPH